MLGINFSNLRRVYGTLAFLMLGAAISVPAGAVFPDRPTQDFNSVGEIMKAYGDRAWDLTGSAVAIGPHWVLSVAHVGGNLFIQGDKQYTIAKKIQYKEGAEPADLALFYIPETIKYYSPIADQSFDRLHDQTVSLVGYGKTCKLRADGKGWQPVEGSEGKRLRVATNTIDKEVTDRYNLGTDADPKWHTSETLVYDLDKPGDPSFSTLGTKITPNEGGIADKDSGGGWFVKVNGKQELVAVSATVGRVASTNMPSAYCYGGLGFGVYLTPYNAWIYKQTGLPAHK
jgi:hypothetical protein